MQVVRKVSIVPAPPERVWAFLTQMDVDDYLRWHPKDHLNFRRLRNPADPSGVGQVVQFRERIGKHAYTFSCRMTASRPGQFVEFRPRQPLGILRLGRGYFKLSLRGDHATCLEAVVELGWSIPVLGPLFDQLVGRLVDMQALRTHIIEEGQNMTTVLQSAEAA